MEQARKNWIITWLVLSPVIVLSCLGWLLLFPFKLLTDWINRIHIP